MSPFEIFITVDEPRKIKYRTGDERKRFGLFVGGDAGDAGDAGGTALTPSCTSTSILCVCVSLYNLSSHLCV